MRECLLKYFVLLTATIGVGKSVIVIYKETSVAECTYRSMTGADGAVCGSQLLCRIYALYHLFPCKKNHHIHYKHIVIISNLKCYYLQKDVCYYFVK